MVGWSVDYYGVGWVACWLLVGWLVNWGADWLIADRLCAGWSIVWLLGRFIFWLVCWLVGWVVDQLIGWIDWLVHSLVVWLVDILPCCPYLKSCLFELPVAPRTFVEFLFSSKIFFFFILACFRENILCSLLRLIKQSLNSHIFRERFSCFPEKFVTLCLLPFFFNSQLAWRKKELKFPYFSKPIHFAPRKLFFEFSFAHKNSFFESSYIYISLNSHIFQKRFTCFPEVVVKLCLLSFFFVKNSHSLQKQKNLLILIYFKTDLFFFQFCFLMSLFFLPKKQKKNLWSITRLEFFLWMIIDFHR